MAAAEPMPSTCQTLSLLFRFILSLASCKNCVAIDDRLNILPISSHMTNIKALPPKTQVVESLQMHVIDHLMGS